MYLLFILIYSIWSEYLLMTLSSLMFKISNCFKCRYKQLLLALSDICLIQFQ